ncbi:MAG: hypothetical protein K0S07_797 [Chlamydiales bacterium]|jgi:hypothetical protein|nr:hypothetical protein [Chlamydiales bacterium]
MNLIAPIDADINILKHYQFRSEAKKGESGKILGVYKDSKGEMLVEIKEDQLTLINRIKSWFGRGPLAHMKYSLKEVSLYLQKFDWQALYHNADFTKYRAYPKVCRIANRALMQLKSDMDHAAFPRTNAWALRDPRQQLYQSVSKDREILVAVRGNFQEDRILYHPIATMEHINFRRKLDGRPPLELYENENGKNILVKSNLCCKLDTDPYFKYKKL